MILYVIVVSIAILVYVIIKLTFWKRQKLTNIVLTHHYKASWGQTFLADHQLVLQYGKVVGTYQLLSPVLMIAEPKLINEVLGNKSLNFLQTNVCNSAKKQIQNCVLFSGQYKCQTTRDLIEKSFTNKNLLEMSKHFSKSNYELIDILKQVSVIENVIDLKAFLSMFTLKSYLNCCFGAILEPKTRAKLHNSYQQLFETKTLFKQRFASIAPKLSQFFNINPMNSEVLATIVQSVKDIYDNRQVDKCKNSILFMLADAYIEHSNGNQSLTQKQIIDNTIMISIMGYKTSLTTVSHLIYYLSINQSIQQKLIKEVDQFYEQMNVIHKNKVIETTNGEVGNHKIETDKESNEEKVDFLQKLNEMQFLDLCIKETLRLCPPVVRLSRTATKDTKLCDYLIPKNSEILIPVYAVHRDPDNYSDPEQFKPDRFSASNISKICAGSYLPFGDGSRNCIGSTVALLEMKLSIISILKTFRFAKCTQTKELHYTDDNQLFDTISPNNVFVKIIKRSKGVLK